MVMARPPMQELVAAGIASLHQSCPCAPAQLDVLLLPTSELDWIREQGSPMPDRV